MELTELKAWATPRQAEIIDAVITAGSQRAAAKKLGVTRQTVGNAISSTKRKAAKQFVAPEYDLIKEAPAPFTAKGYTMQADGKGNVKQVWYKADLDKEAIAEAMRSFTEGLKDEVRGIYQPVLKKGGQADDDLMACYIIGDHHLGMKADPQRTGGDPWDIDIAEDLVVRAVAKLARRSRDASHGLLVNLGDFFTANDSSNQTPASKHALDVDGTFCDAIRAAARIYRSVISIMLEVHETVTIINARGNHDPDSALWLNEMIRELYIDEPRVVVLDNSTKFVHYRFGKNLIVTHHGDRIKPEKLCEHATSNLAKDWGECDYRFGWMGHIHHQTAKQLGHGMLIESWSVLCAPDGYASDHGYSQVRSMSCVMLNSELGEDCRHKVGIKELRIQ